MTTSSRSKSSVGLSSKKPSNGEGLPRGAGGIPCPPQLVTPPQSPQYLSGLDFLKVSLWLDWSSPWFMTLLDDFKREFQDDKLCSRDCSERSIELGGWRMNMQRTGAGRHPYVLKSADMTLLFSNHRSDSGFPNCRIEIGSVSCWEPGWLAAFDRLLGWLKLSGASVVRQRISEFHVSADLLNVSFASSGFADVHRWITRSNKWSQHGEHCLPNYQSFGKGDFMLRVYDKTAELRQSPDSAKTAFFHGLWSRKLGSMPSDVTRVEFQIRREVSKELKIDTISDLSQGLDAVWSYCTNEWCRFCARPISAVARRNNNHARCRTAVLWDFVRSIVFSSAENVFNLVREKVRHVSIEQLQRQAAGCLLSICGVLGLHCDDFDGHLAEAIDVVRRQFEFRRSRDPNEYRRRIETSWNAACLQL